MLNFNFQYIKSLASPGVWRRGYDYYQKDQVESIGLSEEGIIGKVKGNFRDEYTTRLIFSQDSVTASCDCPFPDEWCKHAVAVALIGISRGFWEQFWGMETEETKEDEIINYQGNYKFLFNQKAKVKAISLKIIERKTNETITEIETILRSVVEAQKQNLIELNDKEKAEFYLFNFLHKFAKLDSQRKHFYIHFDKINELIPHFKNIEELRHAESNKRMPTETNALKLILSVNISLVGNVLVALHWKRSNPEDIIPYEEISLFAKRIQWGIYKNTFFPIETKVGDLPYFLSKSSFLDIKGGDGGKFLFEQLPKFKENLEGELEIEESELVQKARLEALKPKKVLNIEMQDDSTIRASFDLDFDGMRVPYLDTSKDSPYVCVVKGVPPPKQYSIEEFRSNEAAQRKADIDAGLINPATEEKKLKKVIRIKVLNKDKNAAAKKSEDKGTAKAKTDELQDQNEKPTIEAEKSTTQVNNSTDLISRIKAKQVEIKEVNKEVHKNDKDLNQVNQKIQKTDKKINEINQEIEESKPSQEDSSVELGFNILSNNMVRKTDIGLKKHTVTEELDLLDMIFSNAPKEPKVPKTTKTSEEKITEEKQEIEEKPKKIPKKRGRPPKKANMDSDSIESSITSTEEDLENKDNSENKENSNEPKDIYWVKRDFKAEKEAYKELLTLGLTRVQTNKFSATGDSLIDFVGVALPKLLENDEWIINYPEELARIRVAPDKLQYKIYIDFDESRHSFILLVKAQTGRVEIPLDNIQETLQSGQKYIYVSSEGYCEIPVAETLVLTKTLNSFDANKIGDSKFRAQSYKAGLIAELLDQNITIEMSDDFKPFWDNISSFSNFENISLPEHLNADMREYQKKGLGWLYFLFSYGLNGILADDMGLGKTLQAISLIQKIKENSEHKPSLVICPTSVVFNWEDEIKKFTPDMKYLIFTGSGRQQLVNKIKSSDVVVTSYALLRRDIEHLKKVDFRYIILDESQKIKNHESLTASLSKTLRSSHRLALSGTPIENKLSELWSVFDFLMPGFLYDFNDFKQKYVLPIEEYANKDAERRLKKVVFPFILRRLKQNVAKDLPDKLEFKSYCELLPEQRDIYIDILHKTKDELFRKVERDGMAKSQMSILTALLRLRQICCHPKLIGDIHDAKVRNSGKFEHLKELIKEVIEQKHKILVFSQFVEMLNIIRSWLEEEGIPFEYLTGSTVNRKEAVDNFNNNPSIPIFLISLKAGGTGLNLTAADYVIHVDPWWNPAVEDQATDRAHRIGQTKKVFVYKMITKGTVEEKIIQLQHKKRDLIDSVITVDTSLSKFLTFDDLKDIFSADL